MRNYRSSYLHLLLLSAIFFCAGAVTEASSGAAADKKADRIALEIGIGIGGGYYYPPAPPPEEGECPTPIPPPLPPPEPACPPPPPPPLPPPLPPVPRPRPPPSPSPKPSPISPRVLQVLPAVKRFQSQIDVDPKRILRTWRGKNVCKYKGFFCLDVPDKNNVKGVIGTDFNNFGFASSKGILKLDGFIEDIVDLVFFHANSVNITSLLTHEISKLRFFYELDLSNNQLTGGFPRAALSATNLTFLDVRFNDLVGPLPPEVFDLDLRALFVNNNRFSGKIPNNLGRTPVFYLTLSSNKFEGRLPSSLGTGNTSNTLIEVLFLNNSLSGCLPHQIGLLKRNTVFDVSINKLTGPIPHSFGCLSEMRQLNLSYNQFSGAVPETVCKLPNLLSLSLQNNYFTEVGPECRKLIKNKKLDVSMNCIIDLPSQRHPSECKKFYLKYSRCPDEAFLLTHVPCKLDHLLADVDASESDPAQEIAPSPAYAALDREYRHQHN